MKKLMIATTLVVPLVFGSATAWAGTKAASGHFGFGKGSWNGYHHVSYHGHGNAWHHQHYKSDGC